MKLVAQDGEIEAGHVVAREVAALEKPSELSRAGGKPGEPRDVGVRDVVDRGRARRNPHPRVEAPHPLLLAPVGMDLDTGDLDDPIEAGVRARRLGVEHDEGSVEGELVDHVPRHVMPVHRSPFSMLSSATKLTAEDSPLWPASCSNRVHAGSTVSPGHRNEDRKRLGTRRPRDGALHRAAHAIASRRGVAADKPAAQDVDRRDPDHPRVPPGTGRGMAHPPGRGAFGSVGADSGPRRRAQRSRASSPAQGNARPFRRRGQ